MVHRQSRKRIGTWLILTAMLASSAACRHKELKENMAVLEERVAVLESAVRAQAAELTQLEVMTANAALSKGKGTVLSDDSTAAFSDGGTAALPSESALMPEPAATPEQAPTPATATAPPEASEETDESVAQGEKAAESAPGEPPASAVVATETLQPMPEPKAAAPPETTGATEAPVPAIQSADQRETSGVPSAEPAQVLDVPTVYKQALQAYFDGKGAEARQGFDAILKQRADDPLAPNAAYWLAEVAYRESAYQTAQQQFQHVIEHYPKSDKAADALLKVGKCLEHQDKVDEALETYRKVIADYPTSAAATLAKSWF